MSLSCLLALLQQEKESQSGCIIESLIDQAGLVRMKTFWNLLNNASQQNFFGTHSTGFIRFFQEMWIWKSCTYIFWKRRQVYIDYCRRIILPFYKAIFIIKNLRYCLVEYQSSHGAYDIISKKWRTIPCKSLQMFVLSLSHIVWLFIKFIKFVFLNWI